MFPFLSFSVGELLLISEFSNLSYYQQLIANRQGFFDNSTMLLKLRIVEIICLQESKCIIVRASEHINIDVSKSLAGKT